MEECLGVNANDYIGEGGTLQLQLLETEVGLKVGIIFSNKHLREGLTLAYFQLFRCQVNKVHLPPPSSDIKDSPFTTALKPIERWEAAQHDACMA